MSRLVVIAPLLLALAAGLQTSRLKTAQADLAQARQEHAEHVAAAALAAASAVQAARTEEQRRTAALQEIADAAHKDLAAARADARRARAAAAGLRNAAQAYAAAHCGGAADDSATAPGGPPAAGPGLVLADLLGRADDRAGELAAAADAARAAGLACERAYDSLTPP